MRIIFIAASFTGVVAYAGYSAAIVSTLSSKNDPIQSPEALINSHLGIGMRGGFLDTILKDVSVMLTVRVQYHVKLALILFWCTRVE